MWQTIQNAFKIKDIRKRLLFTFLMLVVIRLGSNLPVPGVNAEYLKSFIANLQDKTGNGVFSFFSAMTGGSFEQMSVLALSITPYITAQIIMELMTIAIPKLEELQKEGEDGRKKMTEYTRYLTIVLSLIESIAMAVGFGRQGLLYHYGPKSVIVTIAAMTAGSAFLMWIGERINENGVGNGISIVLLFNILSSLPSDLKTLVDRFITVKGQSVAVSVLNAIIIAVLLVAMTVFVVLLCDAERHIPVQYSAKTQGRRMNTGSQASVIPLKVNTAGVIPVIFASSLMSFPVVIAQFFNVDYSSVGGKILNMLNSSSWFNGDPLNIIGLIIYIVLIILFAYFYTSITFNPLEVANNMKKSAGFIPGIRPGKPTSDYLNKILNYVIFLGATGLVIVALIPIIVSSRAGVGRLSFLGNSLIIIVGVVLETMKSIESQMLVRNYKGFLSE